MYQKRPPVLEDFLGDERRCPLKTGLTVSEEVERPPVLKDPFQMVIGVSSEALKTGLTVSEEVTTTRPEVMWTEKDVNMFL